MQIYFAKDKLPEPAWTEGCSVALGAFDGVHTGHQALIRHILSEGKRGAVHCFCTPPSGAPCLTTVSQKIEIMRSLGVQVLILQEFTPDFRETEPTDFLSAFSMAQELTCGYNYRFGRRASGTLEMMRAFCEERGILCHVEPEIPGVSSTGIREALAEGDTAAAARMLGRPFSLGGRVEKGDRIGSSIGFPTANLLLGEEQARPAEGVYRSVTTLQGKAYPSMTNVGGKPTVREGSERVETHIFGEFPDLYGEMISVAFYERIRDIVKFSSLEELQQQLEKDKKKILE